MADREIIRNEAGEVVAELCVSAPLSDEERSAFAELAEFVRKLQQERDPENVLGDLQRRKVDRIWKRDTPGCPHDGCDRIENHDGRCLNAVEYAGHLGQATARTAAARSGGGGHG